MTKKDKPFNTQCEEFRQNLIGYINNSGLPISVVYYMMQLITKDLEMSLYGILNTEAEIKRVEVDSEKASFSVEQKEGEEE